MDDEPVSREVLQKIVSAPGTHQVTAVEDAKSAWALLDDPSRYFDVAFIDLAMPEVDGYQLLHRIRQNPLLASTEVVICTGSKDRASLAKAIQLGARHYLVKPVTKEVVLAKLSQIRPSEAAPAAPAAAGA
ncbi:MAG: response regulator [Verrucomicrobia bacterium]|nr:response regulator [Verrucomicrobiota bacterium]